MIIQGRGNNLFNSRETKIVEQIEAMLKVFEIKKMRITIAIKNC